MCQRSTYQATMCSAAVVGSVQNSASGGRRPGALRTSTQRSGRGADPSVCHSAVPVATSIVAARWPYQAISHVPHTDAATVWGTCEIAWYGQRAATIEVATGTALWHTDGSAPLPLRWVLVRNAPGRRPPLALFCTDPTTAAEHIVAWYVDRWHIKTTFEEVRAHLGLETQREWSTRSRGPGRPVCAGALQCGGASRSGRAPAGAADSARG